LCVYFLFIYKDKPCADKTGEHTQALGGAEKNKRD